MWKSFRWAVPATIAVGVALVLTVTLRPPDAPAHPILPEPSSRAPTIADTPEPARIGIRQPTAALPEPSEPQGGAPCDGCLDQHAAMDVAETLLHNLGISYLETRAELYADIPWLTPERRSPPLPLGLADAPADYSDGPFLPHIAGVEAAETWVVWYQIGWMPYEVLENRIQVGDFPPIARSWPRLKSERFLLLNARTGRFDPTNLYTLTRHISRSENARRAATERARDFLTSAKEAR